MDSHVKEAVFEDNIIERGVAGLGSGCEDQASAWWTVRPELSLSQARLRNPGHQYQNIVPELGRDVQGLVTASRLCGPEPSSLDGSCW
jgi:hypothetical protein